MFTFIVEVISFPHNFEAQLLPANPWSPFNGAGLGPAHLPGHALAVSGPGERGVCLGGYSARP